VKIEEARERAEVEYPLALDLERRHVEDFELVAVEHGDRAAGARVYAGDGFQSVTVLAKVMSSATGKQTEPPTATRYPRFLSAAQYSFRSASALRAQAAISS